MRILDRQRNRAFYKAYLICFVALVGLVVVIDAFANLDEFSEVATGTQLLANMGRYYLVRMSAYFDRLSGVIAMMAAVFATTWMQRNNELVAMLAAGIGTKRIIRPILVAAGAVNLLAVANQEWIIPRVAEELQKPPDDYAGRPVINFRAREDRNGLSLLAEGEGDPATRSVKQFHVVLPEEVFGVWGSLGSQEARYVPESDTASPRRGGWVLRKAELTPPDLPIDPEVLERIEDPALLEALPRSREGMADLGGETYFLHTEVGFKDLLVQRDWYRYAETPRLIRALGDPSTRHERNEIAVYLHGRLLRPLLGMALLFVALPQVLGRDGRNMFVNLGLSLGTSAMFYLVLTVTEYLGGTGMLAPAMAAWAPLIGFGTVAAARWDGIQT